VNAQNIQFSGERIEIWVRNNSVSVHGDYHFRNSNTFPLRQTLYYPFIVNEHQNYPDSISVIYHSDQTSLVFSKAEDGIRFSVNVPANDSIMVQVKYIQKTTNNQVEYMLTSTQTWKRSLAFAEYIVRIPEVYRLTFHSIPGAKRRKREKGWEYSILKRDFMPTQNLKIRWEEIP